MASTTYNSSDEVRPVEELDFMLTTKDNPFNPYENFDEWFSYDRIKGYNSSQLLARFVQTSFDLSPYDQELAIAEAIEEIIELDPYLYEKAYRKKSTLDDGD